MSTLKECWDVLDGDYGNLNTLVSEIYNEWETLKPPKSDKLPEHIRLQWMNLTQEMFDLETLKFPEGYDPKKKPLLVIFWHGSDKACCAVAYLVWTLSDGSIHVSLVTSRTKIAALKKISTPRIELNGGQLSSRLKVFLQ